MAAASGTRLHGKGEKIRPTTAVTRNAASAARFPARLMAPDCRQLRIWRPNNGWWINQASSLGLDRAKHHVASNTKGTVGRIGRIAPSPPSASASHPAARNPIRRICFNKIRKTGGSQPVQICLYFGKRRDSLPKQSGDIPQKGGRVMEGKLAWTIIQSLRKPGPSGLLSYLQLSPG